MISHLCRSNCAVYFPTVYNLACLVAGRELPEFILIDTNGWKRPRWQGVGIFNSILWMSAGLRQHPAKESCYLFRSGVGSKARNVDADPSLHLAAQKQGRCRDPHSGGLLPHMLTGINYKCPTDAHMRPEGRQILLGERTFASTLRSVL